MGRLTAVEQPQPRAPRGLGESGRALWRDVLADLVLDRRELALLARACALADRVDELEQLIRSDGLMVPGSTGQQRLNPALAEQRQTVLALGRLLGAVTPPSPDPASRRAARAARSRWSSG